VLKEVEFFGAEFSAVTFEELEVLKVRVGVSVIFEE
jgi:hypothetical protein